MIERFAEYWPHLGALTALLLMLFLCLHRLLNWARKRPPGAYLILALFPLMSLFPIPPSEVKKLEQIKQQQTQEDIESEEPKVR
ncbi:hypothetical protein JYB88_05915 [Shewanella cyperi]|uniref:Uncharacterized protein n=1 Tax=Shewanella cyperi TaxID=2814292 RepID=A0A975AMD0_9GAMM|nr:hypothetical protein [Shewanella cyperi]QSX31173.1 hypothetical protein JYB88_05915 [Shewanella cyperi]